MATASGCLTVKLWVLIAVLDVCFGSRMIKDAENTQLMRYHKGALLNGKIAVNLIWYGSFSAPQRAIVADFITSLSGSSNAAAEATAQPSVAAWWKYIEKYYSIASSPKNPSSLSLYLNKQILVEDYSLGKSLTEKKILQLASRGDHSNAVNVVLTAADVTVDGFCVSRCGTHGSRSAAVDGKNSKFAYIWVGNSETQCPGFCAWPFHQPIYGPQSPPLVAPNNDVGLDGMVINLGALLAGTATNPFGNGFYQGPATAPLEAATACPGVYAKGAYPGYAGDFLVDPTTGGSYNANGDNGRKYLLPAIFDPSTTTCSTLV